MIIVVNYIPRYITHTNEENLQPIQLLGNEVEHSTLFWANKRAILQGFAKFVKYAFSMATSSAAAERVFSILKRVFTSNQKESQEDYTFLSTMLQFNDKNKVIG